MWPRNCAVTLAVTPLGRNAPRLQNILAWTRMTGPDRAWAMMGRLKLGSLQSLHLAVGTGLQVTLSDSAPVLCLFDLQDTSSSAATFWLRPKMRSLGPLACQARARRCSKLIPMTWCWTAVVTLSKQLLVSPPRPSVSCAATWGMRPPRTTVTTRRLATMRGGSDGVFDSGAPEVVKPFIGEGGDHAVPAGRLVTSQPR